MYSTCRYNLIIWSIPYLCFAPAVVANREHGKAIRKTLETACPQTVSIAISHKRHGRVVLHRELNIIFWMSQISMGLAFAPYTLTFTKYNVFTMFARVRTTIVKYPIDLLGITCFNRCPCFLQSPIIFESALCAPRQ